MKSHHPASIDPDADGGRCLVCSSPIQTGNLVRCARCETPHHRDCFNYTGRCAVYACGSCRYLLPWEGALPGSGPRVRERLRHAPRARSLLAAGNNEIRIEATGPVRSLGLRILAGAGGVATLGSFWGCSSTAGMTEAGLGEVTFRTCLEFVIQIALNIEGIAIVAALFVALMGITVGLWLLIGVLVPGVVGLMGFLVFSCDGSHWSLAPDGKQLFLRGRFLGLPISSRCWSLGDLEQVMVGPEREEGTCYLTARFKDGSQLWLADDLRHDRFGYTRVDLRRLGDRISEATGAPLREVPVQPVLREAVGPQCEAPARRALPASRPVARASRPQG